MAFFNPFASHPFDPSQADEWGLVAVGGDLLPTTLLQAYRRGVFPWFDEGDPILWWSPDPRAIFELESFHVPRRLARTLRSGRFTLTRDQAFAEVIRGCAQRQEGTWVTPEMITAYEKLHALGHAHSVEAWVDGKLAGGIYGVALGGFFAGESMFTRITDGSKASLVGLVAHLRERGFRLFDVQMTTPHTLSLGAVEISRHEYLARLKSALACRVTFT